MSSDLNTSGTVGDWGLGGTSHSRRGENVDSYTCVSSDISPVTPGEGPPKSPSPPTSPHEANLGPCEAVTAPHPGQTWLEGLLRAVGSQRGPGRAGKWQCPAHARTGDHTVSLGVGSRRDGTGAWVVCHAGCSPHDVLRPLALTMAHLRQPPPVSPERHRDAMRVKSGFPTPKAGTGTPRELGYRFEAFHYYGDDFRKERLRHPVTGQKAMQWEARNHKGEWVPGLLGTREYDLPLYRERDVAIGIAMDEPVLLVESESSVDALKGWYATTWAGGAGSAPLETIHRVLGDYPRTVVIADHDDAGQRCARLLRQTLPLARVVQSDVPGEDAKDLFLRLGPDAFRAAIDELLAG